MNQNIKQLFAVSQKPSRTIIGLMSGTSLDGLDIALCRLTGAGLDTAIELLEFTTITYDNDFKDEIKAVFSKKMVDLEKVCLLNAWVAKVHATMINDCLSQWNILPEQVDAIASHGQTIYHAPQILHQQEKYGNATLQIGDGDHLAMYTGILTISDFRQKHIAAGGEGAPLAVYGDYLIFGKKGENRVMLNIGGIANFTYLPGTMQPTEIFSSDVGPGNTLMDAYVQTHFQIQYDKNAAIAKQGKVHHQLLEALKNDSFFKGSFPKTTGPELFNLAYLHKAQVTSNSTSISHEDVMATLNKFTADMIVYALEQTGLTDYSVYSSGGGMHNPLVMEHLKTKLPNITFKTTADLQINPDAKEAVLFAILANETLAGGNTIIGNGRNGIPDVSMGKISFPK